MWLAHIMREPKSVEMFLYNVRAEIAILVNLRIALSFIVLALLYLVLLHTGIHDHADGKPITKCSNTDGFG